MAPLIFSKAQSSGHVRTHLCVRKIDAFLRRSENELPTSCNFTNLNTVAERCLFWTTHTFYYSHFGVLCSSPTFILSRTIEFCFKGVEVYFLSHFEKGAFFKDQLRGGGNTRIYSCSLGVARWTFYRLKENCWRDNDETTDNINALWI